MNVFISYSSKEYDKASALRQVLVANSIECWMAPQSIPFGGDYGQEIPKAIKSCDIFLLLLSESAQTSKWVPKELDNAINEGKIIIPFHADESNLNDAFNFMLSNVQRIEAFNRLSDAYKQLIVYIKSIEGETDFSNVVVNDYTEGKRIICPISFNTMPGKSYIAAKETNPELPYRSGPITINHEESYWVLTTVNNMCPDENSIAENVRLSMAIKKVSDNETLIESVITCPNAVPKVTRQSIHFHCDTPFELEYYEKSGYMYSEYYGLHGSKGMLLSDDIMTEKGAVLGFWEVDGKIPGGIHNSVTVSIKVRVLRKLQSHVDERNEAASEQSNTIRQNTMSVEDRKEVGNLKAALSGGNMDKRLAGTSLSGVYLGHSGFLIESKSATMIFDWSEGKLPEIDTNKPLYVFISHVHADHFNPKVFEIADAHPHAEIFLGYDNEVSEINNMLETQPDKVKDNLSRFDGKQRLYSDDEKMLVSTLASTDLGVAFIVEIDGKTIYHARDLFLMQMMDKRKYIQMSTAALMNSSGVYMGSYDDYLIDSQREFEEYTEPLR